MRTNLMVYDELFKMVVAFNTLTNTAEWVSYKTLPVTFTEEHKVTCSLEDIERLVARLTSFVEAARREA